jgi:hypothetical protein
MVIELKALWLWKIINYILPFYLLLFLKLLTQEPFSSEPTPDIFEHFLLGLIWETKVDTESRVDASGKLPLFCQFGRVVVQNLHVSFVQLDNLLVGLYSFRGD